MVGLGSTAWAQGAPITFSAMGDIPYTSSEFNTLDQQIRDHNKYSPSLFCVHIGDIKSGSQSCTLPYYGQVAAALKAFKVPFYILPGDNEWNDCSNPDQAWGYWVQTFGDFERNFCGIPNTQRQGVRHENFAFLENGVLFIGINLVGGSVQSSSEWATRLQQDADWVSQQFTANAGQVRAAVVFGHAGPGHTQHEPFFTKFRASAKTFNKPVLYVHGDGHSFTWDKPWPEQNIQRLEVDNGGASDPIQLSVSMAAQNPFSYNRDPFTSGTQVVNMAPCVEAGPDQSITIPASATLVARVTDDGDPSPANLVLTWSKLSGPGTVTFGNAHAASTSASVNAGGTYVLRLTASDGQLSTSDDLTLTVNGGGPQLAINDVTVAEGDTGTSSAVFTVSLTSGTGAGVTVTYATAGNTAASGSDFDPVTGTLTFAGSVTTRTITVPIRGDLIYEGPESFFVNLSNASGAGLLDSQGLGTINDNDPAPPPAIASFTPASGGVGTVVTINGSNFLGASAVKFNGTAATAFTVQSAAVIQATVPTNATTGKIAVTTPGGPAQSPSDFVVTGPPPTFTFAPIHDAHVNSGSTGSNYGSLNSLRLKSGGYNSYLKFDLSSVVQPIQKATLRLYCFDDSPDGGAIHLVSNDYLGTSTPWLESGITWTNAPAIGGSPIAPAKPAGLNAWVEYDVSSAVSAAGIYSFGVVSGSTNSTYYNSKEATTNRPELVVETASGPPPSPTITAFNPTIGPTGTVVTIDGTAFSGATAVKFNGAAAAAYTIDSAVRIRATVPVGASSGRVAVTTPPGTGVSAADFTVVGPPAISSFSPASGSVGAEVTVNGSNFVGVTGVTFNGAAAAAFTVTSSSLLRATVPAGASTGKIAVSTPGGTAPSATNFVITGPPPALSFAPIHDAQTNSGSTGANYGSLTSFRVRGGSGGYNSFLKFEVAGLTTAVQKATLRLYCTDDSPDGGAFYTVSNTYLGTSTPWVEGGITWANAPAITGSPVAPSKPAGLNAWVEYDVTSAVTGNGTLSFGAQSANSNSAYYNSKEAATNRPELVIQPVAAPPTPEITSFTPASGLVGSQVTVSGSGFTGATAVAFNGAVAAFTVDGDGSFRATVPAAAATGPISVTTAGGTATSPSSFTVLVPPAVTGFSPASGPVGTVVTINGTAFVNVSAVRFNGVAAVVYTVDSAVRIRATVPAGATSGKIAVTTSDGTGQSAANFIVIQAPTIASFAPASGQAGAEVTVRGTGFSTAGAVAFNGTAAAGFTADNDSTLRATVPMGATTGPIAVTNPGGTATSASSFTVLVPPVVTSFTPASGPEGIQVTISGRAFASTSAVTFHGAVAIFAVESDTVVLATVPTGATTGKIVVTNADGTGQSASNFIVVKQPTVESFSPASGPVGTEVTVYGSGFTILASVAFNGAGAVFTVDNDGTLRATVPSGATSGPIAATNAAGTGVSISSFTVLVPPVIASFTPDSGPVGTVVTVQGSAFTGATGVAFNGTSALFFVDTDSLLRATVPAGATSGRIAVTNGDGTGQSPTDFVVIGPAYVASFAPSRGPVGIEITVRGSGLAFATAVDFNGTAAGFTADNDTVLRATVPAGATSGPITVTNPIGPGTSATSFNVVPPPTVASFAPASGVVGAQVTVHGTGFVAADTVRFNGARATFTADDDTTLRATVPAGATTGPISVTNPGGTATSASGFTVLVPPVVSGFSPASGPEAAVVTIDGGGFVGVNGVSFNGAAAVAYTVDSPARIRATVPAGATTGKIAVANGDGTGQSASDFIVIPPPTIASFVPASGPIGTEVTINGDHFVGVTGVSFNGVAATTFTAASSVLIRATVPAGATTGKIAVGATGGTVLSGTDFTVTAPAVLSFAPSHDVHSYSSNPTTNYGGINTLRIRNNTGSYNSFLKFDVSGVVGPVQSAILRLYVNDDSPDGGTVYLVSNNYLGTATPWVEGGLNWNNAPAIGGTPAGPAPGAAVLDNWLAFNVTAAVPGNGTYSFGIKSNSTNSAYFSSKEGASPPVLVVTTGGSPGVALETTAGTAYETSDPIVRDAPVVDGALPLRLALRAYPSPSRGRTTFAYAAPRIGTLQVTLFDLRGRRVRSMSVPVARAGAGLIDWDGTDSRGHAVPTGVYLYRFELDSERGTGKLILQR